jgi:hypothetical protein
MPKPAPFQACGRWLCIKKRGKTTSINICFDGKSEGPYEWRAYIHAPTDIQRADFEGQGSIDSLINWLKDWKGAVVKGQPRQSLENVERPLIPTDDREWLENACPKVEAIINDFLEDFIKHPYRHRVEHSIHVRLFSMLSVHSDFEQLYSLAGCSLKTQLVHKEWPEYIPLSPDRRGNHDLSILTPKQVERCSRERFRIGDLAPPIAIEIGLDYGQEHLTKDVRTLVRNQLPHGYAIQLTRTGPDLDIERKIQDIESQYNVKIGYASFAGEKSRIKHVGAVDIRELS